MPRPLTDQELTEAVRLDFRNPPEGHAYRVTLRLSEGGWLHYWVTAHSQRTARALARDAALRIDGLAGFRVTDAERVTV